MTIKEIVQRLKTAMDDAIGQESHLESWLTQNEGICDAIDALKELDKTEQEPVAYGMWDTMIGYGGRMMMVRLDKGQDGCTVPLYTAPAHQNVNVDDIGVPVGVGGWLTTTSSQPEHEPVALAWAEGYRMGIADERTSEANIGIAGFNAKVEPARENPYVTTTPQQEAKDEPVAWMHTKIDGVVVPHRPADLNRHPDRWTALYKDPKPCPTCEALARTVMLDQTSHDATPPQRKPLTDEEIEKISEPFWDGHLGYGYADFDSLGFARAIEAAHGIKENT